MKRVAACLLTLLPLTAACEPAVDPFGSDPRDPTHWYDGQQPRSVGRSCSLEHVPDGGLRWDEIYSEPHAEGCDGLVCMALWVDGSEDSYEREQVFCTCRCSTAAGDPSVPLCRCGEGMHCRDDVYRAPGTGYAGGYCVPCITEDDDRFLDPHIFARCDE